MQGSSRNRTVAGRARRRRRTAPAFTTPLMHPRQGKSGTSTPSTIGLIGGARARRQRGSAGGISPRVVVCRRHGNLTLARTTGGGALRRAGRYLTITCPCACHRPLVVRTSSHNDAGPGGASYAKS